MEGPNNEIQELEVSSIQETIEQRQAQETNEAVGIAERFLYILEDTAEQVLAITSAIREQEWEAEREQERIMACDHQMATLQEECSRERQRLTEINSRINHYQEHLNTCIETLNNIHMGNRSAQLRENTILALIEEERQLIAEFESHGYSVSSNFP